MDALVDRLLSPVYAIPLVLLAIYSAYSRFTTADLVPAGVPWLARDPNKYFSKSRAALSSFKDFRQWLDHGYQQVGTITIAYEPKAGIADQS